MIYYSRKREIGEDKLTHREYDRGAYASFSPFLFLFPFGHKLSTYADFIGA